MPTVWHTNDELHRRTDEVTPGECRQFPLLPCRDSQKYRSSSLFEREAQPSQQGLSSRRRWQSTVLYGLVIIGSILRDGRG